MKKSQLKKLVKEVLLETMNRRDFIKKATMGAAGVAATGAAVGYGLSQVGNNVKPETSWGNKGEEKLIGTYKSNKPSMELQLNTRGKLKLKNLQSGKETYGKWWMSQKQYNLVTLTQEGMARIYTIYKISSDWSSIACKISYHVAENGAVQKVANEIQFVKTK